MTDLDDPTGRVTYKLTQKIPTDAGTPGLITTLYLSAAEFEALVDIPADTLRKVRSSFQPLGVDVFEGPLAGLVLAKAEFDTDLEESTFRLPDQALAEVTADVRFTGGQLVGMSANETIDLLRTFGIER
jgi:hypothetical protein